MKAGFPGGRPRRLLVTGASGQLGSALVALWPEGDEVVPLDRARLDVTDGAAVARLLDDLRPDAVLNAAAYNDVDRAENEPREALRVNALAAGELAASCDAAGAVLVHFSSDFVFDGTKEGPWTEEDEPNPLGVYGASKLRGERLALASPRALVLRVESLFGGPRPKGSVDRVLAGLKRAEPVRVFSDRTVSPTYVPDLVALVARLLDGAAPPGLYHAANEGETTWRGLAEEAARLLGVEPRLLPVRLSEAGLTAPRPLRCALDPARLRALGLAPPGWQDALRRELCQEG